MQLQRGAVGICCAKLSEAEVMVAAGVTDVLITTQVVEAGKLARLAGLCLEANVATVIDSAQVARRLSHSAAAANVTVDCLVDLDVGQHRTGVRPGPQALQLAQTIDRLPNLRLRGIQAYEGHLQFVGDAAERRAAAHRSLDEVAACRDALERHGLSVQVVTTAGTGTVEMALDHPVVTEVQPGSYVVMDSTYAAVEGVHFEQAIYVLTTVISRGRGYVITDAGTKAVSTDYGPPALHGVDGSYRTVGDEHGRIEPDRSANLRLGQRVLLVPSHCDTTINLYDKFTVMRSSRLVGSWPIDARGKTE
jgi:3-hydroxy-D-aspartate aldolase